MTNRLSLTLGLTAGPVITLGTHQLIYLATLPGCAIGPNPAAHAIPALGFAIVLGTLFMAHRDWRTTAVAANGGTPADERRRSRGHFMALMGVSISAFCALLVLAQWLAMVVFGTCTHK